MNDRESRHSGGLEQRIPSADEVDPEVAAAADPPAIPRADLDPLTGLRNAAAFDRDIAELLSHGDQPFAIVVVDVESFGRYDRSHGRRAGEALLRTVARAIDTATRQEDRAYRFLGDLFALLMAGEGHVHAERVGERIQAAFAEFASDAGLTEAAVRFGTAHRPADGEDRDTLLAAADAGLRRGAVAAGVSTASFLAERDEMLESLLGAAEAFLGAGTRAEIATITLERAMDLLAADAAFVAVLDGGAMRGVAARGEVWGKEPQQLRFRRGEGLWGRVWEMGRVLAGEASLEDGAGEPGERLNLGIPLCRGDEVLGLVGLTLPAAPLAPVALETLARLGTLAGTALGGRPAARDDDRHRQRRAARR